MRSLVRVEDAAFGVRALAWARFVDNQRSTQEPVLRPGHVQAAGFVGVVQAVHFQLSTGKLCIPAPSKARSTATAWAATRSNGLREGPDMHSNVRILRVSLPLFPLIL